MVASDSVGQTKAHVTMGGDVDDVHRDAATKKTPRAWRLGTQDVRVSRVSGNRIAVSDK